MRPFLLVILIFQLLLSGPWPGISLALEDSSFDPYQIFLKHYEASGGLAKLKNIKTTHIIGKINYDGLQGSFVSWEKKPLRSRFAEDYQVLQQVAGDDGDWSWFQDTNGRVLINKDEDTIKRRQVQKRLERFEHLDKDSPFFTLYPAGKTEVKGHLCYVVRLENRLNQDVSWFYFDTVTFLQRQQVTKQPDVEFQTLSSDYREVNGVIIPFHEKTTIIPRDKTITSQIEQYQYNIPIQDDIFAIPSQRKNDYKFLNNGHSTSVRFQYIRNSIYLPVEIRGETHLWLLDSGASSSIIDGNYAKSLGLVAQGEINGFGFGDTFKLKVVTLPPYKVKALAFKSQKIFLFANLAEQSYEPKISGILGYDFLSRLISRIDYHQRIITFYDPAYFSYHGNGVIIAAPLRYNSFTVPVTLDGRLKQRWNLDLGAEDSSLYYQFAQKHGYVNKSGVLTAVSGLGGPYLEKTIQAKRINIADFSITKPLLSVPLEAGKGSNAIGEIAGNLGNSLLRHFTLIIDYDRQQVIIEKGGDFATKFPQDKSGMVIGVSPNNQPIISYVAPRSPGDRADFMAGDTIVKINHLPISHYQGVTAIRKLLTANSGTIYSFLNFPTWFNLLKLCNFVHLKVGSIG